MEHDYYQILGVAPNADTKVIAEAYRQRAMACHPDRGGSHEQMVLVNEAWEILSNPELRQRYDEARAKPANLSVQRAAAADAQQAHQQAEQYPRRWANFEVWLDGVAKDVTGAKYKGVRLPGSLYLFPTAGNSLSGWVFIVLGSLVFSIIGITAYFQLFDYLPWYLEWIAKVSRLYLFATGGAWVGALAHMIINLAVRMTGTAAKTIRGEIGI